MYVYTLYSTGMPLTTWIFMTTRDDEWHSNKIVVSARYVPGTWYQVPAPVHVVCICSLMFSWSCEKGDMSMAKKRSVPSIISRVVAKSRIISTWTFTYKCNSTTSHVPWFSSFLPFSIPLHLLICSHPPNESWELHFQLHNGISMDERILPSA